MKSAKREDGRRLPAFLPHRLLLPRDAEAIGKRRWPRQSKDSSDASVLVNDTPLEEVAVRSVSDLEEDNSGGANGVCGGEDV